LDRDGWSLDRQTGDGPERPINPRRNRRRYYLYYSKINKTIICYLGKKYLHKSISKKPKTKVEKIRNLDLK